MTTNSGGVNPESLGQGKGEATEQYDKQHGKYDAGKDPTNWSEEERWGSSQHPKAPDPSPFKVGPMSSGGR